MLFSVGQTQTNRDGLTSSRARNVKGKEKEKENFKFFLAVRPFSNKSTGLNKFGFGQVAK